MMLLELMVPPPVRFPLPVLMLMLVAPVTDQLSILLSPLVIVEGVAAKLAICGTSEPKPLGLPAVPHPQLATSSKQATRVHIARFARDGRLPAERIETKIGFVKYLSFMSYLAPGKM
jgi:hypothetical protein